MYCLQPGNLPGFGWPGCESVCAVHYPPFDADSTPMGRRSVENLSSHSRILASTTKTRQVGEAVRGRPRKVDMTNIQVTQRLPRSAEVVWALIGDFGGLHRWHPQIRRLDLSWQGRIRTLHYVDGGRAVERLEARNDTIYRYTYVLVDSSLPVQACRSTLEVQAAGAECMVTWSSNFEALGDGEGEVEVEEALRTVYIDGLGALATALGGL